MRAVSKQLLSAVCLVAVFFCIRLQARPQKTVADFDGDKRTDFSVFSCSNSTWYLQESSVGYTSFAFGQCGDIAVPGDYDGDGKTDIAVFSPGNGTWYVQGSRAGYSQIGFGSNGDVPVPGDYDGDGKTDYAVFRCSNSTWYMQQSSAGYMPGVSSDSEV